MKFRIGVLGASILVLAACGQKAEKAVAPPPPKPVVVPFNVEISTKELMKHAIDPAADIVWAASGYVVDMKGTTDNSPTTPEGWTIVENNATVVAELSNALMLPDRAPGEAKWNEFANKLHVTAMASVKAAQTHDKAGLLSSGSEMFLACTACHKYYVLGEKN